MENGQFDEQRAFFEEALLLIAASKQSFKDQSNELKKELNQVTNSYNTMIANVKNLIFNLEQLEKRFNLYVKMEEPIELPTEEKSKAQLKKEEQRMVIYNCLMESINTERRLKGLDEKKVSDSLPRLSRGVFGQMDAMYSEYKDKLDELKKVFWYIISMYLGATQPSIQERAYTPDTILSNFHKHEAAAHDFFKKMITNKNNYDNDR